MRIKISHVTYSLLAIGAFSVQAQMEEPKSRSIHSFGLSYRAGFNISADFNNIGAMSSLASPGPASGGGVDRIYDDGYVRVDVSGNAGGQTWFWGYNDASQVAEEVITMNAFGVAGVSSKGRDGDPQHGVELLYQMEGGEAAWGTLYGFEAALNYTDLSIRDGRALSGNVTRISDSFSTGGIIVPTAPYAGTFGGPGPLISDSPTRATTVVPGGATILGNRTVEAQLFGFRLGPYWQIPFNDQFSLTLGGGLVLAAADSRFSYRETVSLAGGGTFIGAGSDDSTAFLIGGYLSGTLKVNVSECWHLFGGVQYQNVGDYSHSSGLRSATVDLGESFFISAGAGFSF